MTLPSSELREAASNPESRGNNGSLVVVVADNQVEGGTWAVPAVVDDRVHENVTSNGDPH
jgi:hypothetical protein